MGTGSIRNNPEHACGDQGPVVAAKFCPEMALEVMVWTSKSSTKKHAKLEEHG